MSLLHPAPSQPSLDELAQIGIAEFETGRDKVGAKRLTEVLQRDPQHPGALVGMSMTAMKAGQDAEGERYLDQALQRDPGNFNAHMALAFMFNHRKNFERAQLEFEAAHKAQPMMSGPVYNLAYLASQRGDLEKSLELYREYLKMEPTGEDRPEIEKRVAALESKLRGGRNH
jgi:Tfp pilus assembly protein PilF